MTLYSYKSMPLDLTLSGESGLISGYASVFHEEDRHKEKVMPKAFTKSLEKWKELKDTPKMLWNHDFGIPIGVWTKLIEDERGLYVEGKLELSIQKAREIHSLLAAKAIDGLSIGYRVLKSSGERETGCKLLHEIDLFEISFVSLGANPKARVLSVKNHMPPQIDELLMYDLISTFKKSHHTLKQKIDQLNI
jgi:uncharacterized protein